MYKFHLRFFFFFAETTFKSVVFTDGSDLDLSCSLTSGAYSTITLSKVKVDGLEVLAIFRSNGSTEINTRKLSNTSRVEDQGETFLTLTLMEAGCDDNATYRCSHVSGQISEGHAIVNSMFKS